MQNDSVYPNDGQYFQPLAEVPQQQSNNEKREATLAQLPLLKEIVQRLNIRIAGCDSIQEAMSYADQYETDRADVLIAMDIVRKQLERERSFLLSRIDSAAQ